MANIYQAGGKAVGKLLSKGAPSKVYSAGAKGESAIAEKLGAAISEKEAGKVVPEVQAKLGAMEAMKLLQEEGTPTFKTTQADLQAFAKDNPNASPEELAKMYRGEAPAKPTPYRMKEKVESVSAPREIEEPASQERVYEAYGRAADGETRFADEEGAGLEGLVSRPQDEVVGAGMGGLPPEATLADRVSAGKKGLTKTQKTGAGLAAVGGAGVVKGALTPEDEDKSVPGARLTPKITGETYKDIKFEPSVAEAQAAVDKGGMETTRALWDRYDKLNAEFQKTVTEGGMAYSDPKKAAALFIQGKQPPMGPPRAAAGKPAVEEKVSDETEKMTTPAAEIKKKEPAKLAPSSGGVVSEPRSVQGKRTASQPQSQREIALGTELNIEQFKSKLASGQPISRSDLLAITNQMEQLKVDPVKADPSLVQKIESAKEEARRAYQQEASRNQWAEVAQTLGNAVATFIAARQGVADRPLTLPQIDYGARTGQALRAYQTELSAAGEQARTLERETDRKEREAEKAVALQQRQYQQLLSLGEKDIEARERKAERAQDLATRLTIAQLGIDKANQVQAARDEKAKIQAKQQGEDKLRSYLASDIKRTNQQITSLNKQLEAANQVATSKDNKAFEKALPDYMTSSGIDINTPEFQKKGWFGGVSPDQDKIKASAQAAAARLLQQVKELQAKKATSEQDLQSLRPGADAAPAQQPTRQEPAKGGRVVMVQPDGTAVEIDADKQAAFMAKYPGSKAR